MILDHPIPALHNKAKFVIATDQPSDVVAVSGFEPVFGRAFAVHAPGRNRFVEAFQRLRFKRFQIERCAQQAMGVEPDDELSRRGDALQPGRQIRRLAGYCLRVFGKNTDKVADDDLAGGDADPGRQCLAVLTLQTGNGGDGIETCAYRAFGLILERHGPAKISEDAVAEVLGDVSFVPRHLCRHGVLVSRHKLAQIFWIELPRQFRRADKVAEHHGQLASFRIGRPFCCDCRLHLCVALPIRLLGKPLDRCRELAPRSHRQAELFQIIVRKIARGIQVDLVFSKRIRIFAKPEFCQQLMDIVRQSTSPLLIDGNTALH